MPDPNPSQPSNVVPNGGDDANEESDGEVEDVEGEMEYETIVNPIDFDPISLVLHNYNKDLSNYGVPTFELQHSIKESVEQAYYPNAGGTRGGGGGGGEAPWLLPNEQSRIIITRRVLKENRRNAKLRHKKGGGTGKYENKQIRKLQGDIRKMQDDRRKVDRETERQRDRETERQRDRETERQIDR